jgi:CIC family chloride channel protein
MVCRPKYRRLIGYLARLSGHLQPSQATVLIGTALVVGLGAGGGAILFRWLIDTTTYLAFTGGRSVLPFLGAYYVILIPAIGGLFVGPMIYFFAREAKGHGVPEVMEAVALRGGRIRPIVVVVKSLASSICIGTGGSVGREGPIVQIGSALGSTVGQWLKLSDERVRNLVACGAAGGIAATFNAPIAGVIFALEVIAGEFSASYFSTVVISSVTASEVARAVLGDAPAFMVPPYSLVSPWEFPLYAILGVFTALIGLLFVVVFYKFEDIFDAWKFPEYLKPMVGGLLIGAIGLFFSQIFGVGYATIELALHGEAPLHIMAVLIVVKMLATSITIGSGGSGGVFAPSLFLGAMLGGGFGTMAHTLFPAITAVPGAYALVGMAAVFAAATRAPITSILILFEMTGDYRIILPLMLATVVSTFLAERMCEGSIYTLKLSRRGVRLQRGRDIDVMQTVRVDEVMETQVDTVPTTMRLPALARAFERTHHHGFPVLDHDGELYGMVSIRDVERALSEGGIDRLTAGDIATTKLVTVYPDEPMSTAIERMAPRDLSRLPVVDRAHPRRLLGIIRRGDLGRAYNVGIMRRAERQHRADQLRLGPIAESEVIEFAITADSPMVDKMVHEVHLPEDCLLVAIRRGQQLIVPHGPTRLAVGDRVTVFGTPAGLSALKTLYPGAFDTTIT